MNEPQPANQSEDAINHIEAYRIIGLVTLTSMSAFLSFLAHQLAWPWFAVLFLVGAFAGIFVGYTFGIHLQKAVATMAVVVGFLEGVYRGWRAYGWLGAVLGGPVGVLAGVVLIILMLMSISVVVILCGGDPFVNGFPEESSGDGVERELKNPS
jgi:hypothetical protein